MFYRRRWLVQSSTTVETRKEIGLILCAALGEIDLRAVNSASRVVLRSPLPIAVIGVVGEDIKRTVSAARL